MAERAVCPVCGGLQALLKGGGLWAHRGRSRDQCPGSGVLAEPLAPGELALWEVPESSFQLSVLELAGWRGWEAVHFRPLMDRSGRWQTPVQGSLGAGWPDLVLVRARDRRLVFAELKRMGEDPDPAQERVLAVLRALEVPPAKAIQSAIEVHVWHPGDLRDPADDSVIGRILR